MPLKTAWKLGLSLSLGAMAAAVAAATALRAGTAVNVSRTPTATEKAKAVRLAYADGRTMRKAWLYTYADGPEGRQDIYVRFSFDEGTSWSAPVLLSRDAAGAATGGASITVRDALVFAVDNDKPSIFASPDTAGPKVVITWNSAYCPAVPGAGPYVNPAQGANDFDGDGALDRPFHCVWVATTVDPTLAAWDVQQLTTGERDAIGEVVSGNATGTAFALAWQEDPAGLQPGEAEGRGDGGMGSHVTAGTNIWYTHAPSPNGATLRANVAQLSDNNAVGSGQPGASRPNLQLSGSVAAVAYEESGCPGSTGGKCIVYHAFPYASHDTNSPGTIVSDPTRHARRVRFVLQGAAAAGGSPLRAVMLWRDSAVATTAAPADIVLRRGLVDPVARPGSTGFSPADLLADPPQRMTDVARSGGNTNAHRAIVRGGFVGLAYDLTPDMNGADPERTAVPTANYNLHFTRSTEHGSAGSWSPAVDLSRLGSPEVTVVEPRLVPTPGTIVNPLTGVPDAGDTQNPDTFFIAYATERNTAAGESGRVYVARSTDRGASFEPFMPVSAATAGQSESQLRPLPDGSSAMVLWMGELVPGDVSTKEAMFGVMSAFDLPDLALSSHDIAFTTGGQQTLTLTVANHGAGDARNVVVTGVLPERLQLVGIGDPGACSVQGSRFRCTLAALEASRARALSITLGSTVAGAYTVDAGTTSDEPDADAADNAVSASVLARAPLVQPTPTPSPAPDAENDPDGEAGGGCTMARGPSPVDPVLPLLAVLSVAGLVRRRPGRRAP
jgi:uncharacterized repeat protein (TIGR01451 family)